MGKTIGYILLAAAAVWIVAAAAIIFFRDISADAAVLGFVLMGVIPALLLGGAGAFFTIQGRKEAVVSAEIAQERKLLNIVKTQGQVAISDLVLDLNATQEAVHNMIYSLVGKGIFSGYVNWDDGTLYSEQASQLRDLKTCRKCGGELDLAGKGVIKCPFCGTEYFL